MDRAQKSYVTGIVLGSVVGMLIMWVLVHLVS